MRELNIVETHNVSGAIPGLVFIGGFIAGAYHHNFDETLKIGTAAFTLAAFSAAVAAKSTSILVATAITPAMALIGAAGMYISYKVGSLVSDTFHNITA